MWRGSLHHWQDPILSHFFSKNHSIPAVFSLRPILISFVLFCFFFPFFGFFPELWTFWVTRLFFFFLPILFKRTNQSQESFDGTNFYLSFLSYTHGLCIQCKCSVNVLALISISSLKFTTKWCCFFFKEKFPSLKNKKNQIRLHCRCFVISFYDAKEGHLVVLTVSF